ncbi:DUF3857 domain-containing protein [Hymenobacter sp. CRA2]|uniref:DUF3857 domain-containing protein n=1 Tax=Hymenobacter sp. CRA2 TaxID=1955620 RepID=UPI00098ECD03|nr:DUF3857 domain-containing protein [Hymenobacter sp. CRA2]OON67360.1 hypothetical protein B0919_17990 [Hymenobacter sp. CRA2]
MQSVVGGLLGALLACSVAGAAIAQDAPIKFGKVEAKDFDPATYHNTADAPAVVLCDFGQSRIAGGDEGFYVVFERVTRVLVLNKAGYEQATVRVPLYRRDGQEEKLLNVKGFTYNLVGGKVEKQKLDESGIFREQVDNNRTVGKFTLPSVREGSILEYTYTVKSGFVFNLQDWQFQRDIPVEWSEYRTLIPGFYTYKEIPHGYLPYKWQERKVVSYSTSVRQTVHDSYGSSTGNTNMLTLTCNALNSRWVMEQVPAFREEAYMTTPRDYLAALDFELDKIQWDEKHVQQVTSTWEKISEEMLKDDDFGGYLKERSSLTPAAQALATQVPDPAARAAAAVALVQQAVRYNGETRMYAHTPLKRVLEQKQGTSAELNLLLIRTLRDAGLQANPVLVSTRSHGRIQTEVPLLSQFNYTLAQVSLAPGQDLLLDATNPLLEPGTLPEQCLNGQGRLIGPQGRWVSLLPTQRFLHFTNARLVLDEQGNLSGNVKVEYGGYAGVDERGAVAEHGEKDYVGSWQRRHPDWKLTRSAVQRLEERAKPLLLDLDVHVPGPAATTGQPLYLPVMQLFADVSNPFPQEQRRYPVDFGMAHEYTTTVLVTLPAGYTVEELPAKTLLELPNGDGRFVYEATLQGQTLQLTSRLLLRKAEYQPREYAALRELFTRSLAKHREPLVLRRP